MNASSHRRDVKILSFVVLLVVSMSGYAAHGETGIPLAEHPRPDFMRDAWVNLNGQWDFALDPDETGEADGWHDDASQFDRKITVPFSWAAPLSGIAEPDVDVGWYSRTFRIPDEDGWRGKRVFIVIGASDFGTKLWVNGSVAGEHEGGYTPFDFELTDFIRRNETNRVVIRVEDESIGGRPVGKQNDYGPAKGIWQTVYLEGRSENSIRLIHFSPDIDNEKVSVKVSLEKQASQDMDISVVFDDGGVQVARSTIAAGSAQHAFDIPIPNQRLWTLDDPYLYDLEAVLQRGTTEYDRVRSYFGMRKISTGRPPGSDDMYIMLNNKAVYLQMALDQAFHPEGFYTFPSDEFVREEVLRAKNIGLNGLRIHIKTGLPRKLYWADKLGILIQSDMPNFWGGGERGVVGETAKKNWTYTALNQIMRDYNHPSIFSWVLFNETWGLSGRGRDERYPQANQDWVQSLYYWAKELDPTRLVEDNSPDGYDHIVSDINCWHRYLPAQIYGSFVDNAIANTYPGSGWNYVGDNTQTDIPLLNTECGAEHGYRYGTGDIDISFEYHIMVNEFRRRLKNTGFVFTQFHDVIDEWNGYYRYDRTIKEWGLDELCPGMTINDFHSDMYVIPGDDFFKTVEPGTSFTIPITASFTTDELPDEMTVQTVVHGWNRFGEHKDYSTGQFTIQPKPYSVLDVEHVTFQAPDEECLAVMYTHLIDENGKVRHRNFVPFRVDAEASERKENGRPDQVIIRLEPDDFSDKHWSVKQFSILDGLKVWGTGMGYFEYEFTIPENITIDDIASVEFLAELSSRAVQGKYMREGDELIYTGKHFGDIGEKAFDSGYGFNTFPMTDAKKHTSAVTITLNDTDAQTVFLSDDPADHRGLLSWLNQIRPESMAWKDFDEDAWELEEAGSYGYRVSKKFDREAIERALDEKVFRIKLAVDESSETSGGLAVYGENFGRYPLGPTVIIRMKQTVEVVESNPFPKHVEVFGVHVYATAAAPDDRVLHAANVLAEWLDSDEDGTPDNQKIVDAMVSKKATLVAAKNSRDLRVYDVPFRNWQNVWTDNVRPLGEGGRYDEALEEILHLITDYGWEVVYPSVFGREPGTKIAEIMDVARGGHLEKVPEKYPDNAWYTYYDESCDYGCQIGEYLHWALTTILGGQDYPGTFDRGGNEWFLRTREALQAGDPAVCALLSDPQYKLPTVLPDANYRAKKFTVQKSQ